MINGILNSTTYLEKALDTAWLRNEVILNNIANVDTPEFKASHVEFKDIFKQALSGSTTNFETKQTRSGHIEFGSEIELEPKVVRDLSTTYRMDGNNVDIDKESSELAENSIYYNLLIQKISNEFSRIKLAITESK